jgi:hypothetical protein
VKVRKLISKFAVVAVSLLWLTPSYICAMDTGRCPLLASISQSTPKNCSSDCCQTKQTNHKHTAPCQTNSSCGTQQNAVTSESLVLVPSLDTHFVLLPLEADLSNGIRIASSRVIRSPARGHPVLDFFSNSSNLSPPSLS